MKLRVGLVGLGDAWQHKFRPALCTLSDWFEVRGVYDQVGHRARQVASEFGTTAVDGFRTLLGREDIDAALLLAAQWYGTLPILAACGSGKAVYCGAELDLIPEEAERIKRSVEEAGIAFMAEFPHRQSPATLRLKELIATRLGPPQLLFCHRGRGARPNVNHVPEKPLQRAFDQELIGLIDWCCFVVGEQPAEVTGLVHTRADDSLEEDYQMLTLHFSDREHPGTGAVAQISCGRYVPDQWHEAITYRPLAALQISCKQGIAFVDLPSTLIWFDERGRHQESLENERPVGEQLLAQFHRIVTSPVHKTSDLEDACRALSIAKAARQSHSQGRRIAL